MRPHSPSPGVVCFLLWTAFASGADFREWTRSSDGRTIKAEFAGMKDAATVKIKTVKGHVFEAPLASLSAEDKEYVRAASSETGPGAMAGATKPALSGSGVAVALAGVHLCCDDCVAAVAGIGRGGGRALPEEVALVGDRSNKTILVRAASDQDAQRALDVLLAAGFYGVSNHVEVRMPDLERDGRIADAMVVRGAHLCCGGCVKAFVAAVESVAGVERCEAEKGAVSAKVAGKSFKPYEVMLALRESGFGGSAE